MYVCTYMGVQLKMSFPGIFKFSIREKWSWFFVLVSSHPDSVRAENILHPTLGVKEVSAIGMLLCFQAMCR